MEEASEGEAMAARPDFSEVYEESLPQVWRYVAARIPQDDAQDVTSEVFTRAWQSWSRFDSSRGSVTPWLCGIAHRTIADWWRRRKATFSLDPLTGTDDPVPDLRVPKAVSQGWEPEPLETLLQDELAGQLRQALESLNDRERDALALRFGAGMAHGDIARILDLSIGATKMLTSRTIVKLRALINPELATVAVDERTTEVLEEAIQGMVAPRRLALSDPVLGRLVDFLAILHETPMPETLPDNVKECLSCLDVESAVEERHGPILSFLMKSSLFLAPGATRSLLLPCVGVCGAFPILGAPLVAVGLISVAWALHVGLFVIAPLNVLLLWLNFRRHREPSAMALGSLGAALIVVAVLGHFRPTIPHDFMWLELAFLALALYVDWQVERRPLADIGAG